MIKGKPKRSRREKEAWMAGARSGMEIAFEMIIDQIKDSAKGLGLKLKYYRKPKAPPNTYINN